MPDPTVLPFADSHGRVHTDLRLSLTDRCSLRCTYCMPEQGLDWLPARHLLSDDEVVRIARVAVERLGIRSIRLTGGEPLLRRGLVGLVGRLAELGPRPALAMTTNGIGLARTAADLAAAGLDRVTVSLDTVDRDTFRAIAHRDRLADVLAGIDAAVAAGLQPVKVNAVLLRGVNDGGLLDLLEDCLRRGVQLRVIEQMPLDAQHDWSRAAMVTAEEVLATLSRRHRLTPLPGRGSRPAELYDVDSGRGTVGIIASVSRPFCGACDRIRVTADGQLRTCLFARTETDLRTAMRDGADDDDLERRLRLALRGKAAGHGIDDPTFLQPARPMSAIGG